MLAGDFYWLPLNAWHNRADGTPAAYTLVYHPCIRDFGDENILSNRGWFLGRTGRHARSEQSIRRTRARQSRYRPNLDEQRQGYGRLRARSVACLVHARIWHRQRSVLPAARYPADPRSWIYRGRWLWFLGGSQTAAKLYLAATSARHARRRNRPHAREVHADLARDARPRARCISD